MLTASTWFNTTQSYDIAGNLINVTDANQHTTWFSYNDNYDDGQNRGSYGLVTAITNALGQLPFQAQYDFSTGQATVTADLTGQYTTYNYSGAGYGIDRLSQVNYANGGHSYYSFPSAAQAVTQQDQNNSGDAALKQQTLYDGFGRPVETDVFEGGSQTIATTQSYDALGRVTQVQTPDGAVATTKYTGNQITSIDPAGHARQTTVDALGRLGHVVEDPSGLNYLTQYTFGANDTLQKVVLGSQTRTFHFDSLKRLTAAMNPESGSVSYTYDNAGNVLTRTDNRGITTNYSYDALNRVTQTSYSDGTPAASYGYDAANVANSRGHLTTVSNANSVTNYTNFDALGNVLASSQVTAGRTYAFAYGYNLAGALSSETYPSGRVVTTGYDGANRPNAVNGTLSGQTKPYAYSVGYWPHGGLYYFGEGNNVAPVWTYNNRLQVNAYYATVSSDANRYLLYGSLWYGTTNNGGNLYNASEANGNAVPWSSLSWLYQNYSYDNVNRLTGVADTGYSRTFGYDQWGNMWVTGNSGVALAGNTPTSNVFNAANQMAGNGYDAAGNLLSVNGNTASYDAENRLMKVSEAPAYGGGSETLPYDGLGERVEKAISGGATTVYIYDALGKLAAEYATAAVEAPCTTCYLVWDQLGSTRLVTDQNGNVVARHDYLPYGEEIAGGTAGRNGQWGPFDTVNQKFTGQIRDSETGQDFFNARYFTGALGRFNSPDPGNKGAHLTDPQTWNAYAYVRNNPMALIDPTGMDPQCKGWLPRVFTHRRKEFQRNWVTRA